jgi:hypothetical protein
MVRSTTSPPTKPPPENPYSYEQSHAQQQGGPYVVAGTAVPMDGGQHVPTYQAYSVPNPGAPSQPGVQAVPVVVTSQPMPQQVYMVSQAVTCRFCGHTGPVMTETRGPGAMA